MKTTSNSYRATIREMLFALLMLTIANASAMAQFNCHPSGTVYITGNMNIRESASTDSSVVATARAGDSFTVSQSQRGDTWCWLNIGAGWIARTSRVSFTEPATTSSSQNKQARQSDQQPSDIDNCCYVDRECDTDDEWTKGYWAFQNNQCEIPTDSQQQSQSQATATEEVNNCCFIGWQCMTDDEWVNGYNAYQNNQCAAPSQQQQQVGDQQRSQPEEQSRQEERSPQGEQRQQESKSQDPQDKAPSGDLIFKPLTEEEWDEARCDIYGGSSCD